MHYDLCQPLVSMSSDATVPDYLEARPSLKEWLSWHQWAFGNGGKCSIVTFKCLSKVDVDQRCLKGTGDGILD